MTLDYSSIERRVLVYLKATTKSLWHRLCYGEAISPKELHENWEDISVWLDHLEDYATLRNKQKQFLYLYWYGPSTPTKF